MTLTPDEKRAARAEKKASVALAFPDIIAPQIPFAEFGKIARLSRDCTITEKIDGTNASIFIGENGEFHTGSRNRWITPDDDNFDFSKWAHDNKQELLKLGVGQHFGEWWGSGIQRKYGMKEKVFSLFNSGRWADSPDLPTCCRVVPVLYQGGFSTLAIEDVMLGLVELGSKAAPGFMKPEGIVIWHSAARVSFKKTIEDDESPKGQIT